VSWSRLADVAGAEARRRLPQHAIRAGDVALFDPEGGYVRSELAVFSAFLPALVPQPVRAVLCADGYTADETGLLGLVPGLDGVVVAVGFSGHGFKMAPALGAVAADLIAAGTTATSSGFLDPARFLAPQAAVTADELASAVTSP
jgi:glycine/D-amino acid oxidase-like deaminating enzyme